MVTISCLIFLFEVLVPVDKVNQNYQSFTINEGDSSRKVVSELAKENLIRDKYTTYILMRIQGQKFYANEYVLSKSMSAKEVLSVLEKPKTNINSENGIVFTVIEGDNIQNIAKTIADNSQYTTSEILSKWENKNYLQTLIKKYQFLPDSILDKEIIEPLEGMFTPLTYVFSKEASIEQITEKMLDESQEKFMLSNKKNYSQEEFYQILTLASIVERETNNNVDQRMVAGVFENRLKKGMPLQADITVLYAQQKHKNIVSYSDLEFASPYNLYKNKGITPSPIASPSINAIEAVINPLKTDYYYYYNTPDTGETIYSKTYDEHLNVVSGYQ